MATAMVFIPGESRGYQPINDEEREIIDRYRRPAAAAKALARHINAPGLGQAALVFPPERRGGPWTVVWQQRVGRGTPVESTQVMAQYIIAAN